MTYNWNSKSILDFSNNQNDNREKLTVLRKIRPLLRLFMQFGLLKTFRLIVSNLSAFRAQVNYTRIIHIPSVVAAETLTRKFLSKIIRNKQRCF